MAATRRSALLLLLMAIAAGGAALRFASLGAKPLWLDEAMTLLVSLGRGPGDIPVGRVVPVADAPSFLAYNADASLATVIERLRDPVVQHTHPPLFYLLLRGWLAAIRPAPAQLAADARVLAALFGVAAIFIVFAAARSVMRTRGAVIAAALTAASPLMVMISREARNYTLPLACVGLAIVAVIRIVETLSARRPTPARWWVLFTAANVAGCYAHYFVIVSFAAQTAVLAWTIARTGRQRYGPLVLCATIAAMAFAPWVPTLLAHSASPEQLWMREPNPLWAVYHTVSAWQAMVQGWKFDLYSPQRVWKAIRVVIGLLLLAFLAIRMAAVWRDPRTPAAMRALGAIGATTIIALWIASAVLQKDLLSEYRYHFVYYPPLVVLVAAALDRSRVWITGAILALGVVHSTFLAAGWEFPQLTRPAEVAAVLVDGTEPPALIVVGESSFHETVSALTFILAFNAASRASASTSFVFVRRGDAYPTFVWHDADPRLFWSRVAEIDADRAPHTAWVWSAWMLPHDYQRAFRVMDTKGGVTRCTLDPREDRRAPDDDDPPRGPFRRYRCL